MRLLVPSFGGREWAGAEDLVDLPFDQVERAVAGGGEGVGGGDALGFGSRSCANQIDTELTVGGRSREDDRTILVLLAHPGEMLIQ